MKVFVGIDVSLASSAFCILDQHGQILKRAQVASEPEAFVAFLGGLPWSTAAIGLEAGPLAQWLHHGLAAAGCEPILMETQQVKAALHGKYDYYRHAEGMNGYWDLDAWPRSSDMSKPSGLKEPAHSAQACPETC